MLERPQFATPTDCPTPAGPYSHVAVAGQFAFTAGQVGIDPATAQLAGDDIRAQTRQAIVNLSAALSGVGLTLDTVASVKVYLAHDDLFDAMNDVYQELFAQPFPVRATVVAGLRPGILVELDAVAFSGTGSTDPGRS
jgi:2-iminobutanoate/2-iminopropanoate deaminase